MFQFALEAALLELKQDTPQIAPLLELPPRYGHTLNPCYSTSLLYSYTWGKTPKPPKEVYKKEPRQRPRTHKKPQRWKRNKTPRKAPHRGKRHHETGT